MEPPPKDPGSPISSRDRFNEIIKDIDIDDEFTFKDFLMHCEQSIDPGQFPFGRKSTVSTIGESTCTEDSGLGFFPKPNKHGFDAGACAARLKEYFPERNYSGDFVSKSGHPFDREYLEISLAPALATLVSAAGANLMLMSQEKKDGQTKQRDAGNGYAHRDKEQMEEQTDWTSSRASSSGALTEVKTKRILSHLFAAVLRIRIELSSLDFQSQSAQDPGKPGSFSDSQSTTHDTLRSEDFQNSLLTGIKWCEDLVQTLQRHSLHFPTPTAFESGRTTETSSPNESDPQQELFAKLSASELEEDIADLEKHIVSFTNDFQPYIPAATHRHDDTDEQPEFEQKIRDNWDQVVEFMKKECAQRNLTLTIGEPDIHTHAQGSEDFQKSDSPRTAASVDTDPEEMSEEDGIEEERTLTMQILYILVQLLIMRDAAFMSLYCGGEESESESSSGASDSTDSSGEQSDNPNEVAYTDANPKGYRQNSGAFWKGVLQKRSLDDDDEGDDDVPPPPRPTKKVKGNPGLLEGRLACPFAKASPGSYIGCLTIGRKNLSGVKEHLKRNHFQKILPDNIRAARTWNKVFDCCVPGWRLPHPSPYLDIAGPLELLTSFTKAISTSSLTAPTFTSCAYTPADCEVDSTPCSPNCTRTQGRGFESIDENHVEYHDAEGESLNFQQSQGPRDELVDPDTYEYPGSAQGCPPIAGSVSNTQLLDQSTQPLPMIPTLPQQWNTYNRNGLTNEGLFSGTLGYLFGSLAGPNVKLPPGEEFQGPLDQLPNDIMEQFNLNRTRGPSAKKQYQQAMSHLGIVDNAFPTFYSPFPPQSHRFTNYSQYPPGFNQFHVPATDSSATDSVPSRMPSQISLNPPLLGTPRRSASSEATTVEPTSQKYFLTISRLPSVRTSEEPGPKEIQFEDFDEFHKNFDGWMSSVFTEPEFSWDTMELYDCSRDESISGVEAVIKHLRHSYLRNKSKEAALDLILKKD
ncbi:hypothetical protein TWF694_001764 [Orbilia ellipsospora]|uniref:Uncharacterized protein n=1 Tax=Orbilia ellipsospora TaxID=2528407 RepID=A0AAV9X3H3_9PEZI